MNIKDVLKLKNIFDTLKLDNYLIIYKKFQKLIKKV